MDLRRCGFRKGGDPERHEVLKGGDEDSERCGSRKVWIQTNVDPERCGWFRCGST